MSILFQGRYYLRNEQHLKLINFKINIETDYDTIIIIPRIEELHEGNSVIDKIKYYDCNNLCEGYCIDYYRNGKKKLEVFFKQGTPQGKLYFYRNDGTVLKIQKYDKKGVLKKISTPE